MGGTSPAAPWFAEEESFGDHMGNIRQGDCTVGHYEGTLYAEVRNSLALLHQAELEARQSQTGRLVDDVQWALRCATERSGIGQADNQQGCIERIVGHAEGHGHRPATHRGGPRFQVLWRVENGVI